MSELLPCPLCNSDESESCWSYYCDKWHGNICCKCGASVELDNYPTEDAICQALVAAWNRRADKPAVTVTDEMVERACHSLFGKIHPRSPNMAPTQRRQMRAALKAALGGGHDP